MTRPSPGWLLLAVLTSVSCSLAPTVPGPSVLAADRSAHLPAGAELAYGAATNGAMDLYLATADQATPRLLVGDWADESHPAWSPDGLRLAFVSNRG